MVCSKIIKVTRKWQKMTAMESKISSSSKNVNADCFIASLTSNKGHFVVYTTNRRRFAMPSSYLSNNIFLQLFKMSEEEFGLSKKILIDYIRNCCIKDVQASTLFLVNEEFNFPICNDTPFCTDSTKKKN
ncbi:auxin-responsive protein SAUR64-like [Durio zibethinus]|uniref:Auxin-responsive protein SAUR64-like n=1 Tax=Durio zibethinus TaxID=66656 RepID=A0A6P5Z7X2_DURZI|nr:auxin-responsive protein SAUR64-like [Durio zibethinus]